MEGRFSNNENSAYAKALTVVRDEMKFLSGDDLVGCSAKPSNGCGRFQQVSSDAPSIVAN